VTADVVPSTGHEISQPMAELLVERLRGHVPRRHWHGARNEAPAHIRRIGSRP
jgi:hypothetical protein